MKRQSKLTTSADLRLGDIITIAGVEKPDRRWWPRLKAWCLRRPAPTLAGELKRFVITETLQ